MSPSTITLLFLLFAIVMFVTEKIPLAVTSTLSLTYPFFVLILSRLLCR